MCVVFNIFKVVIAPASREPVVLCMRSETIGVSSYSGHLKVDLNGPDGQCLRVAMSYLIHLPHSNLCGIASLCAWLHS